jgi:hypothetical protein
MVGNASLSGGARHGLSALSHAERQAAQNALSRIKSSGSLTHNATVYGGALSKAGLGAPSSLIHGRGSDTFAGGSRGVQTRPLMAAGNDTVVSGSSAAIGVRAPLSEAIGGHGSHGFALNSDTINVAGATAENVKAVQHEGAAKAHTITLADKTTVTVTGLSHDIPKVGH